MKVFVWMAAVILWLLPASATAQEVTLNFRDADIQSVIKFAAEFSGKNFLIDNRVRGKVTVISPKAISSRDAYEVFLSILRVNGFTAVPAGKVVKILPISDGKQAGGEVRAKGKPAASDALITQIVPVENADAQQLVNVFRPLMSPAGNLVAYAPANLLIITEAAANVRRMMEIVEALDVADVVGFKIFQLQYASAEKLAQTLNDLYDGGRAAITSQRGGNKQQRQAGAAGIKMIAYAPANMLIVLASSYVISEIESVLAKLDVKPEADVGRLQVRYLRNANAEDVAKVLTGVIADAGQTGGQAATKGGAVLPKVMFSGDVKVTPDPSTNALLIIADPADREAINKIIDKLDIRRLQVFVEGLIVEVQGDTLKQLGIEWAAAQDITNNLAAVGAQNFGTLSTIGAAVGGNSGADLATAAAAALPGGLTAGIIQGSLSDGDITIGGIVRALQSNSDANILSTPNLLTMDNEEAEIVVGQNVPFVTGQNATQGGTANPFQTIERKDIGLTLRVTPQISEGDTIRLDIYQEVSSIAPGASATGASDLITNKRSIKTVVLANDEEIIVLGGLIRDDVSESVQKVPCIGSIPILGEPFRFTEQQQRKTNLMVFLRPHIINSTQDIRAITQEKYLKIKGLYEDVQGGGTMLFPREQAPLPSAMDPTQAEEPSDQ